MAHGQRDCAAHGRDWAHQVKAIADHPRYRHAECLYPGLRQSEHPYLRLFFFRAFPTAEAERLARRVPLVFTPRHSSWLHRAEPELSVLTRQALSPRMPTQDAVHAQATAWAEARHAAPKGIHWQFRTADARGRLKHLYPAIET